MFSTSEMWNFDRFNSWKSFEDASERTHLWEAILSQIIDVWFLYLQPQGTIGSLTHHTQHSPTLHDSLQSMTPICSNDGKQMAPRIVKEGGATPHSTHIYVQAWIMPKLTERGWFKTTDSRFVKIEEKKSVSSNPFTWNTLMLVLRITFFLIKVHCYSGASVQQP